MIIGGMLVRKMKNKSRMEGSEMG